MDIEKEIKTGGHAFPDAINNGMTLLDFFAGQALQGLLANPKLANEIIKQGGAKCGWIEYSAYAYAKSMIQIRQDSDFYIADYKK